MSGFSGLAEALAEREQRHLYRRRRLLESPQGPIARIDGRDCISFCSNDYLGLAAHPEVIDAFRQAALQYGVGGGASHLVNGHSTAHHALEEELAAFTGRERALLFSTGYMANLGVVSALLGRGDSVLEDRLNHASLIDAGRLSGARFSRYRHLDMDHLCERLAADQGARRLVVSDGVFSMDGDCAPLPELAQVTKAAGAWLMIDDAHGFGAIGEGGRGLAGLHNLSSDDVPILVGTLGKGFGTAGAFVAGSEALIETLIQEARTYIYTTAMPPAVAEATRVSLRLVEQEEWRRERLQTLIAQFRKGAESLGLTLLPSHTPIQPIMVGEPDDALRMSEKLWDAGILVTAIRPPTVPAGTARLRVTLSATHTEEQVTRLLDVLAEVVAETATDKAAEVESL